MMERPLIFRGVWWEQLFESPLRACGVLFVIFVLFDAFTIWPPGMTLTSGDEPHYLVGSYSLIHDADYDLTNNYIPEQYHSWYDGTLAAHLLEINGKQYALHSIGLSVLLIPGFLINGREGAAYTMMLLMAIGIVQLYALCRRIVRPRTAAVVTVIAACTFPLVAYSRALYPDSIGFIVVVSVLRLLWDLSGRYRGRDVAIILTLLSLLPWFHSRLAFFSVTLFVYLAWVLYRTGNLRKALPFVAIPLVGAVAYAAGIMATYNLSLQQYLLDRSLGGSVFGLQYVGGAFGMLFDRSVGLIWFAPLYISSFWGLWYVLKHRPTLRQYVVPLLLVCGGYYVMMSFFFQWHGGFCPPERYLVPVMPALVIGLGVAYESLFGSGTSWKFKLLAGVSAFVAITGMLYPILPLPLGNGNNYGFHAGNFGLNFNPLLPDLVNDQSLTTYLMMLGWIVLFTVFLGQGNTQEHAKHNT